MKKKFLRMIITVAIAAALLLSMPAGAFATAPTGALVFSGNLGSNMTCTLGQSYSLNATANYVNVQPTDQLGPITYTWYSQNGQAAMTSGNSSTITFTANGNDVVYCVASGSINGIPVNTTSNSCAITVTAPTPVPTVPPTIPVPTANPGVLYTPTITVQPSSVNVPSGQTATLSVGATVPNLGNGVQLAYQWFYSFNSNGSNPQQIPGANSSSYTPPVYNNTVYYFCGILATNGVQNSSIVYSNIVSVSYNNGQLRITKQPTGETVDAGGKATFIARADNAAKLVWRIVSKDTKTTINAKDAGGYFSGLTVYGDGTDTLVLSGIPATMNEWSVECKFIAADGRTFVCSNGAVIRVRGASAGNTGGSTAATAKPTATYTPGASPAATPSPAATKAPNTGDNSAVVAPTIVSQPVGAVLSEGESTTLQVAASAGDQAQGVELKYQWYRNDTNSNANGTAIGGAQSTEYKPDTISGTKYYYVGVWSTDGSGTSKVVYSSPVAVTYTAPLTSPSPTPSADNDDSKGISSMVIGPVIAMALAAAAIGLGVFFLLKNVSGKKKSSSRDAYYDDYDSDDDYRR